MNNSTPLKQFLNANDLQQVIFSYDKLCPTEPNETSFKYIHDTHYKENKQLFDILEAKRNEKQYNSQILKGKTSLIVGGGPAGLITAIETKLHGGNPIVIEKRNSFTRNNVVLLWDYTVDYLKSLGAKIIFRRFCSGGLHHIGIRRLQCLLLKVSLLLGVEFHFDTCFEQMIPVQNSWAAEVSRTVLGGSSATRTVEVLLRDEKPILFDALYGADGLNSKVATFANFKRKTMKAKQTSECT